MSPIGYRAYSNLISNDTKSFWKKRLKANLGVKRCCENVIHGKVGEVGVIAVAIASAFSRIRNANPPEPLCKSWQPVYWQKETKKAKKAFPVLFLGVSASYGRQRGLLSQLDRVRERVRECQPRVLARCVEILQIDLLQRLPILQRIAYTLISQTNSDCTLTTTHVPQWIHTPCVYMQIYYNLIQN